jgi:general secretion pathway protein G
MVGIRMLLKAKLKLTSDGGFTLIELIVIIITLGVLAGVATIKFGESMETSRFEATRAEMEAISNAIVGNQEIYSKGARGDFGYVGDVGSLPPDLQALASNPGGYSTWDGPYIKGDFVDSDFEKDGWNVNYIYSDTLLRSIGSGSNIDKIFAASTSSLLSNSVCGYVLDASQDKPGNAYYDSLVIGLIYPDGSGGLTIAGIKPDKNGNFCFNSIPIGNHTLTVIYIPDSDTISLPVCVLPDNDIKMEIIFPADLW